MIIAIDAMGGDNAPSEVVKGCVKALRETKANLVLVGNEPAIKAVLDSCGDYDRDRISIVHTDVVIENEDSPVKAVRTKKDASLVMAVDMVKNGKADAALSAGNTGALMTCALLHLGRIKGIDRPAIVSPYPLLGKAGKFSLLVDAGANAECKAENLLGFAYMGSIYMHNAFNIQSPKVGLVNIGAEETKGTTMLKETHKLLKESGLNFIGNVEGRDIPKTDADVLVCDGFTGNIVLKLTEGVAWSALKTVKAKITETLTSKIGTLLIKDKLKEIVKMFDYSSYGGAPILGVKGLVFKVHGSSSDIAVCNAVVKAAEVCERDVVAEIEAAMMKYSEGGTEDGAEN